MPLSRVPEFTENERRIIQATINERYRTPVQVRDAEVEVRLSPGARERSDRPALFRTGHGANFVVMKTGDSRFRCQFYYRGHQMFGTHLEERDDIADCVTGLQQAQAVRARSQAEGAA